MADNSEIQAVSKLFFTNCWAYTSAALLIYDYILTFNSEVTLFWMGGRLSGATILFVLNRYITLAQQIVDAVPSPLSAESTFWVFVAYVVLRALQYLPWAAFSALRTYALCPDPYRWPISATVFVLSSVPVVTNMWVRTTLDFPRPRSIKLCITPKSNLCRLSIVNVPQLGIIVTNPLSASTNLKLVMATRSSLIASDLAVLCVTWIRTYETTKLSFRSLEKQTFASILLLDGAVYFLVLLTLSVLHMVFTLTRVAEAVMSVTSIIGVLEEPLTAILTSRFLIDLQRTQRKLADSSQSVSLGAVAFQPQTSRNTNRVIGSLGANLSFHEDGGEENEVEDTS